MTLNIGPAAPGHPRHAAHRRPPRRRAGHLGRAGHRLHAPRLREAHRGPHLPAGHHADQPHRLAGQLRQRGAVHPRRRAADGDRGAAARPVDPHDPVRAVPHRQHRRCSSATWACSSARSRRSSTPSATASTSSTRSRRSPAAASTPTSTASAASRTTCPRAGSTRPRPSWSKIRALLRRDGGRCSSATRSSRPAPAASASSRPRSRSATGCRAPTSAAQGVDWDLRRDQQLPMAWDKFDWKVWTHPDGDSFARYWVRLQEVREATKIVDQLLDGLPSGPIMAKVPRIIKVPEGEAWVVDREPARRDGLLRRLQGRPRAVPGEDPLGLLQQHLDRAVGAAGRVRPRRHHDPRLASTSSSGTSTGDGSRPSPP